MWERAAGQHRAAGLKTEHFADIAERTRAVREYYLGEEGHALRTGRQCVHPHASGASGCEAAGIREGGAHASGASGCEAAGIREDPGSAPGAEAAGIRGESRDFYAGKSRVMEGNFATLLSVYGKNGWEAGISQSEVRISHHALPRQGRYHRHGFIEIFYVIEGSFEQILLGERRHFAAGEIVITDQNCEHADYIQKADAAVLFLWLQPEYMDRLLESCAGRDELWRFLFRALNRRKREQSFLVLRAEEETDTGGILEQLVEEDYARLPGFSEIIRGNLMRLFHLLCTSYALQMLSLDQESKEQVLLYELERYIRLHVADVTAKRLEENFHYHRNYYNLLLRKYTGKSYRQYVTDIRIARAKELLERTALPVKEVAGRVGYENTAFFYRLFERECGLGPTEWRRRHPAAATDRGPGKSSGGAGR